MSGEPPELERDFPLARLTTVRAGGNAEMFARVGSAERLVALLAWARDGAHEVGVVGSGSNLLVADEGVRGLVLKLDRELSQIDQDGARLRCGGGARLPSVAAHAARLGLTGIEFGVNIPGTVGGAVRMNAGAYGGEMARALESVEVATADGVLERSPDSFEFVYRRSNLAPGEIVSAASFHLAPAASEEVRATLASMRERRRAAQPSGIKTFGSTFKNPEDALAEGRSAGQLLDAAGCRGMRVGGALLSEKHANFVENSGDATTADIVALIALARCRVHERFGVVLEAEVQSLGDVDLGELWREPGEEGDSA